MHSLAGMRWVSYPWGCSLFHGLLSVTLTLLVRHRGLWSHSFSLSRGPSALSLSLSISLARAGLAPPSHVGSAPTSVLCTSWCRITFSWPLSRSWHPRMPQKPLVSVSVSLEFLSLYICVMGVNVRWIFSVTLPQYKTMTEGSLQARSSVRARTRVGNRTTQERFACTEELIGTMKKKLRWSGNSWCS